MTIIFAFALFILLPASVAYALANSLASLAPKWSLRRRTVVAAVSGGMLPMLLPLVVISIENNSGISAAIPIIALLFVGLVLAVLVALPTALYVGRRKEPREPLGKTFE